MIAVGVAAGILLVAFVLRTENTRTEIGTVKNNIANRCVQGDDGACRKLLDRLLDVSKVKQHTQLQQIVNGATKGVVPGGGNSNNPSGLPGGQPPAAGEGNGVAGAVDQAVQGVKQTVQDVQNTVNDLLCTLHPSGCP